MNIYVQLFISFFKVGVLTFGGGYAMLPMLEREIMTKRSWATQEELLDYYAIGQCTPGVIAVNTATFIGCKLKGVRGSLVSTLGLIAPSLIIITLIAALLKNFADYPIIQHALAGVRVAVVVLVVYSVIKLFKSAVKDILGWIIFLLSFFCTAFLNISPIWIVIISLACGIISQLLFNRNKNVR